MPQPASNANTNLASIEELLAPLAAFGVADGQLLRVLKSDSTSSVFLVQPGHAAAENPQLTLVLKGTQKSAPEAFDRFSMLGLTARVQNLLNESQTSDVSLAPSQLQTADGKFLWSADETALRFWRMSRYIDGISFHWLFGGQSSDKPSQAQVTPTWSEDHCFAAGQLLARLHCAGQSVKKQLSAEESKSLRSIVPDFGDPDVQATLVLEQTIVHGDFHPGNVLFSVEEKEKKRAKAAIDFDYAHLEHPLYDLAYAWLMFAEPFAITDKKQQDVAADALLSGYRQHYIEAGVEPPSFLPDDAAEFGSPSGATPLNHFAVFCANLLLSWTKSPEGKETSAASSLAKRMTSRIHSLQHL